jgi:hypothetical protein
VIENKEQNFTVDVRAWALLSLDACNLEMKADRWEKTFGVAFIDEDGTDDYWLETVPEAKIRAESINAIGKMAKFAERAKCWKQPDRDECGQELGHFRLNDNLFEEVELMILTHWGREIEYEVKRHLVVALGYLAGWTRLPKPDSWDVIDMLREAANWSDERTRLRVPWAIRCIATNIIHRRDGISWQQSLDALKRLVDLAVDNVKQIEKNVGKERFSRGYDLQRQYILTLRHIALSASAEQALQDEGIVDCVVTGLFRLADCADHQKEVRRLSFDLREAGNIRRVVLGDPIGTTVSV